MGCTSVPDASTDWSRAYSNAPDAPTAAPTVASSYGNTKKNIFIKIWHYFLMFLFTKVSFKESIYKKKCKYETRFQQQGNVLTK